MAETTYAPRYGLSKRLYFSIRAVLENFRFGIHESIRKGDGMTFAGIRDYQEGESLKRVDWLRSLEHSEELDELLVREYDPEKQMQVVVMLDATRGMDVPERKCHLAVALLWLAALSAFQMRDTLRIFIVFDNEEGGVLSSPLCVGEQDVNEFLRSVSEGQVRSCHRLDATALEVLGGSVPNDLFLVVISDFEHESNFFACIADRITPSPHSRLLIAVLDGWDGVAPLPALLSINGRNGSGRREIDARPGGELDLFKGRIRECHRDILTRAWKRGHIAARIPVFAPHPFEGLVQKLALVNR